MQPMQVSSHATRRRSIVMGLFLVAGLLLPTLPARAITGSKTTGAENYPYVGAAWLLINCCDDNGQPFPDPIPPYRPQDDGDNVVRTTGILIAPNVFLTGGVQYRNGRRAAVSFRNPLVAPPLPPPPPYDLLNPPPSDFTDAESVYQGSVYHLPGLDRENKRTYTGFDLAVIILDKPVVGVPFAPLPPLGVSLDAKKGKSARYTAVSYGWPNFKPAQRDFQRRVSGWKLAKRGATTLRFEGSQKHIACDGDQGAPFVDTSGTVTALLYTSSNICKQKGKGAAGGYRLDTQRVHDFLCDVGKGALAQVVVDNTPDPSVGEAPVVYPRIINPELLTSAHCSGSAAARADSGVRAT